MGLITTYEISLDVAKTNYVVIKAKQYDKNSRQLIVHCTSNGQEYVLSDGIKAFVQMNKPDGTIFNADCVVDIPRNVLVVDLAEQATTATGVCDAELIMVETGNERVLSTMRFSIIIIGATITQEDIISQSEFGTLANLIIGYEEAKETVETIEEEMTTLVAEEKALKEEIETKLANGEFDGRTVLYGSGIPAKSLGNVGDVYINTSYTELYPYYLFTKDGEDWTPRWTMIGLDGTDTLPILGTMFFPEELEVPPGYEDVSDFHIPSNFIGYGESTLDTYIEQLEQRISALENS